MLWYTRNILRMTVFLIIFASFVHANLEKRYVYDQHMPLMEGQDITEIQYGFPLWYQREWPLVYIYIGTEISYLHLIADIGCAILIPAIVVILFEYILRHFWRSEKDVLAFGSKIPIGHKGSEDSEPNHKPEGK